MKITTLNPQIITKDAETFVKIFEELGFEKRHEQEGIGELDVTGIRMSDSNGFKLDISEPDMELKHDVIAIRMNVDNFDEAQRKLLSLGFKNLYGRHHVDTGTAKSAIMVYGSEFVINLVEHIK